MEPPTTDQEGHIHPSLHAAMIFVGVSLGLSVAYWLAYEAERRGWLSLDTVRGTLGAARGYGPAIAALVASGLTTGWGGLREIGARLTRWRFSWRLYAWALAIPVLTALAVVAIAAWVAPSTLTPAAVQPGRLILLFFLFALVDGPLGEEIGWRGFLLPRLLEITRPLMASLIVGFVWFVWHLPLYYADGSRTLDAGFLLRYLLLNVACAVLHTWFFQRSGGSALLAVIFHTAGNYFVFLTLSIFPALREVSAVHTWQLAVVCAFALLAALNLDRWRAAECGHVAGGSP